MNFSRIFDTTSYIIAVVTFTISFLFIYQKTAMFLDSIIVGILSAAMFWIGYVTIRICILASKKDK